MAEPLNRIPGGFSRDRIHETSLRVRSIRLSRISIFRFSDQRFPTICAPARLMTASNIWVSGMSSKLSTSWQRELSISFAELRSRVSTVKDVFSNNSSLIRFLPIKPVPPVIKICIKIVLGGVIIPTVPVP